MLGIGLALVAAPAAQALDSSPPDPLVESLRLAHRRFQLENGLDVVIHEDHRAPLVVVHVGYRVGAAEDGFDGGPSGVAHLLEHLMFEGSTHAPGESFDRLLAAAGGDDNAWTDHDWTTYALVAPSGALDLALFLESDRMEGLAVEDASLRNQVAVVENERAEEEAAPGGMGAELCAAALYPAGHPYRLPTYGARDDPRKVTLERVVRFHDAWYRPGNAALVVAGDVDPDRAEASVRRWFSDIPSGSVPARAPAPPLAFDSEGRLDGERRFVFADDVDGATLFLVWPTVPAGHPDAPALDLLADVLGGGRGTRLDLELLGRDRADTAVAWTEHDRLAGRLVVEASAGRRSTSRLLARLDREVAALRESPPEAWELDRQRARWRSWMARSVEGMEDRAALLVHCLREAGEADCLAERLRRRIEVEPADVLRVARAYLHPENRVVVSRVPWSRPGLALPRSQPIDVP